MNKNFGLLFLLLAVIPSASAWIADIDPMPEYCEDCLPPLKVEIMDTREIYQFVVIASMLTMNLGLMLLMYLNAKKVNPSLPFDMQYFIYAVLGVVIGFNLFLPIMKYEGSYVEVFMTSAAFAVAGEGLINKGKKAAETIMKAKQKEGEGQA